MSKQLLILAVVIVVAAACSPVTTPTPAPLSPSEPTAAMTASSEATPVSVTQAAPPAGQPIPTDLLEVYSPADNSVVNLPQVQVRGMASPGGVVTINDEILIVGTDGTFELTVTLEEGPNLIEVIASNTSGSEVSVDLVVTYQP